MVNENRPMTDIEKNNIKLLFQEKVNIFNKKYICNTDFVLNVLDKKLLHFVLKWDDFMNLCLHTYVVLHIIKLDLI